MARTPKPPDQRKGSFIPKTRVETWRRRAYEQAAAEARMKFSKWLRRVLDQASGIEADAGAPQPSDPTDANGWADIDFD